jgi:hypothetical protein
MMTRLIRPNPALPSTCQLLTEGGDERITLDQSGIANKYGCRPIPDNGLAAFGSATASTISEAGFAAADELRNRLLSVSQDDAQAEIYLRELCRVRSELIDLCGLAQFSRIETVFSPSGTELHMLAARLVSQGGTAKTLAVMVQTTETGSAVLNALAGQMHVRYSSNSGLGSVEFPDNPIDVATVRIRGADCMLRPAATVDDEIEAVVSAAVAQYDRILVTLTDVSKTGVLAPSPCRVLDLKARWPDTIEILVDAAQFRLAPSSLRGYLAADCMVAVTGSKFIGGPIFSAVLLVPEAAACRLMKRPLEPSLCATCARAEWPQNWNGIEVLQETSNYGLLVRWEAALAELRAFRAVPDADVRNVVRAFCDAITLQLSKDPHFEPLEHPILDRRPLVTTEYWDQIPTIFPFLLSRIGPSGKRKPVAMDETKQIYNHMRTSLVKKTGSREKNEEVASLSCELGQPVLCGEQYGVQVAALRLCLSARLIVEAVNGGDRGIESVIVRGLRVLEKAAFLVSNPSLIG